MTIETLFPTGIEQFLVGGVFIGIGVGFMYFATGRVVGMSTFFSSTLSWFSNSPFLQQETFIKSRWWRLWCAIGMVIGAMLWAYFHDSQAYSHSNVSGLTLLIGGILVGFGARISNGCTSGHGICGLSSLSRPSFVAVLVFMSFAIATASFVTFLKS